ncbi:MAG: hypothetical protein DRJ26_03090 [Candidatus Methanomethylicota archaeon]|uniref:Transposase n=1 Tax=Thermoproteota archaeon TaxID=2056631 RepID=A0A497F1Y5_9CREN|nr:MAG: hypothetical protein DRJ26_03090 [Candidatus Verstraetearchaeota archaeon]
MQWKWISKACDTPNNLGKQNLGLPNEAQLLTRQFLERIRKRAIRFRIWFKLDRLERAAIDLTIKVVERVKNSTLAQVILRIVNKIHQWLKPTLKERALSIGRPLAIKIACLAQKWGNQKASTWINDLGFIFYLGVSWLNTSIIYRHMPSE